MGKVFTALNKSGSSDLPEQPAASLPAGPAVKEKTADAVRSDTTVGPHLTAKANAGPDTGKWDERLALVVNTHTNTAESFKRLRGKILHPANHKPFRSILVTSAVPEEGKSFVCANLGVTLAQGLEQSALLIDCDLRRPSLARLFGIDNKHGLASCLRKGVAPDGLIRSTGLDKLNILPSGAPPSNPAELLSSAGMVELLRKESNRQQERLIILDTPPMHAAAETAVLAGHVDGVVLVVRWGRAKKNQVKEVIETLGREKIIGIVFNAFEMSHLEAKIKNYYYGSYYGYYSKYYYYGRKKEESGK